MTPKQSKPLAIHRDIPKLKVEQKTNLPSLSKAKLEALFEEAVVDAYGDEEQTCSFFTMIEEHLALPFTVSIFGAEAGVEKVDMIRDGRIVAICQRDGMKQRIGSSWRSAASCWTT
jgi:hypothetical protein